MEQHLAARRARLRRVRQPEDGRSSSAWAGTSRLDPPASRKATTRCSSRRPPSPGPTPNGDGVPQGELGCVYLTAGCEINLAQLPNGFGVASLANFDPNIKRMYNVETSVSVQQELRPGVSVQGGWYHRDFHNLRRRDNTLQTFADYTPFTLYSPIDGTPITYNNVSAAARTADQLRGHQRRREPEDVVQRLRVQLQRAADARHHALRRRHEREDHRPGLRRDSPTRTCCSTAIRPRAASRSARSSRSPATSRSSGASRSASRSRASRATASAPARCRAAKADPPARPDSRRPRSSTRPTVPATVWLITPTTALHREQPVRGAGHVLGRPAGRSGHERRVAVGAADRAEHRVRRSHQPAGPEREQDVQDCSASASSRRSTSSTR